MDFVYFCIINSTVTHSCQKTVVELCFAKCIHSNMTFQNANAWSIYSHHINLSASVVR